jgi:hypothetical protein
VRTGSLFGQNVLFSSSVTARPNYTSEVVQAEGRGKLEFGNITRSAWARIRTHAPFHPPPVARPMKALNSCSPSELRNV